MPRSKPKKAAAPKVEKAEYVAPKKKMYWVRPIKIGGYFMPVRGEITEEHKNAFIQQVRLAMPADQFKNWDFSVWETEVDKDAERLAKILEKRKADIGLK